jgi:hypothetical protein
VGYCILGATKNALVFGRHRWDRKIVERYRRKPGIFLNISLPPLQWVALSYRGGRDITVNFVIASVIIVIVKTSEEPVLYLVLWLLCIDLLNRRDLNIRVLLFKASLQHSDTAIDLV